ncbi:uncharacterized protein LOC130902290 [Diorhabda carinulata]|uniref:uncharacterized protein LOC130902290 n=1 Tax=Diorhabda carinulata TaxID=1163345 RepID=UPI0025A131B0|nr:uncharacterized protein LOC130902290 [Diorhabda carinulata]
MKAASIQTAVNGFKKTDIQPLNPEVFDDWMFEPAETTDTPMNNSLIGLVEQNNRPHTPIPQNRVEFEEEKEGYDAENVRHSPRTPSLPPDPVTPRKSPKVFENKDYNTPPPVSCIKFYTNATPSTSTKFEITPQQVVPLPHAERRINANDERRGKTAILTSTPYKEELEASIEKKPNKRPKLNLKKIKNQKIPKEKIKNVPETG